MNDRQRTNIGIDWVTLYESLIDSVIEAGGSAQGFQISLLKEMSVMELFDSLATNNIKFVYTGSKEKYYK